MTLQLQLIFVHPYLGDHTIWRHQIAFFESRFACHAADLPGHGSRASEGEALSVERLAESIKNLVQRKNLSDVVLIGHSLGCRVVLEAQRQLAQQVIGVVLIDGSVVGVRGPSSIEAYESAIRNEGYWSWVDRFFSDVFCGDAEPDEKQDILDLTRKVAPEAAQDLFKSVLNWDHKELIPALNQCTAQILLLQSTDIDTVTHRRRSLRSDELSVLQTIVRREQPNAKYRTFEGLGHYLMLENPTLINDAICQFAEQLDS